VLQQHRHRIDRRHGVDHVLARVLGRTATHRLEHAHAPLVGVEVAARRHAHAPLQDAGEVGDDVAEHVGGHDHVVGVGVLHHPHAAGVDVVVVGLHVGVVLGHLLERPPPEVVAEREHIGLGDERERLLGAVPLPRVVEGPADAPLAALPRVDRLLHGHLVGRALLEIAADAAVEVFGVFADDDEVDVLRAAAGQRRLHARQQLHRPKVDVLVELEPQLEEQALLQDARRHARVTDRAEEHGVLGAKQVEATFGHDLAGLEVAIAAPVEHLHVVGEAVELRHGVEDLERLGSDFGAGAVTGDRGDLQGRGGHLGQCSVGGNGLGNPWSRQITRDAGRTEPARRQWPRGSTWQRVFNLRLSARW